MRGTRGIYARYCILPISHARFSDKCCYNLQFYDYDQYQHDTRKQ